MTHLSYRIHYSRNVEKLMANLYGRMATMLSLIQLLLGAGVMAELSNQWLLADSVSVFGLILTLIGVVQAVYKPETKAALARSQQQQYSLLLDNVRSGRLSEKRAQARFNEISSGDSSCWGSVARIANNRADIQSGGQPQGRTLWRDYWISWWVGDNGKA